MEEKTSVPELILKLCMQFSKDDQALTTKMFQLAMRFIQSSDTQCSYNNEIVGSDMRRLLINPATDSEKFEEFYLRFQESSIPKRKDIFLNFLLHYAKANSNQNTNLNKMKFDLNFDNIQQVNMKLNFPQSTINITPGSNIQSQSGTKNLNLINSNTVAQGAIPKSVLSVSNSITPLFKLDDASSSSSKSSPFIVTESDLLEDIIYSLQGIEGKYVKKEPGGLEFFIEMKGGRIISPVHRVAATRLLGISYLHNTLKQYCEENDKQKGTMGQALISIIRDELSGYYKTVAILQASIKKQTTTGQFEMSIRRALCVMEDHKARFEWFVYIVDDCRDKKGGALVSAVHSYLGHGANFVQEVAKKILKAVCKPLFIMLSKWLLDGEIHDPCNEFFIEARNINTTERLWHDKYHVVKSMMPSFIHMDEANKILATGKNINFLRQICKDKGELPGREGLQKFFKTSAVDTLFAPEQSLEFQTMLVNVYRESSSRVLDLLKNEYRLLEHLHSLRKYLLLGQGDFIRHLLELLAPKLNRPAQEIYGYTLTTLLETAIRATNAQFEEEDTLIRLNANIMGHSQGDTGWDVFSLSYVVDGPVSTIFQQTMPIYQCLFGALWKAKRMEYVLVNLRKQQITIAKLFKFNTELHKVMHTFHIVTNEMIHFLHQTQYYFLFEVLECSWAVMLHKVNQAVCLDDVIEAHSTFLASVQAGVLLDEESKTLFSQLRSIYNFVLTLETHQESLFLATSKEYEAEMEYQRKEMDFDKFGITLDDELKAKERKANFLHFLNSMKATVKCMAQNYRTFVTNYLKSLSSNTNLNLQLLSVRLSFNDYYSVS